MFNKNKLRLAAVTVAMFMMQVVQGEVIEKTSKIHGTIVHYKVVLPNGYDPARRYPAVIALGGGSQNMATVDGVLNRYFRAEGEKRGYIVFGLAAPEHQLVLWEGADIFPEFFKQVLTEYKIEGEKFHIAGPSNGGIAALEIADIPAVLPIRHSVPRIYAGACRSQTEGDFQDVRLHVRRRIG